MTKEWIWLCAGAALAASFVLNVPTARAKCSDSPGPEVDWSRCEKEKKVLRGQDLQRGKFNQTDFNSGNLEDVNFAGAIMIRVNLSRSSLRGANLEGADLAKATGSRAIFENANLMAATLIKSELARANFAGADLTHADFSKADLSRAHLDDTKLTHADLRFANLARATFEGAAIDRTRFGGAYTLLTHFEGTDLTKAEGLTQDQLEIACGDGATKLPEGLNAPADWPCGQDEE